MKVLASGAASTGLAAHRPSPRLARRSGDHTAHGVVVVLVGIDGAGKTTTARALSGLVELAIPVLVLCNYSGRRTIASWLDSAGITAPPRVLDAAESVIRTGNVIVNHLRARRFRGVVIMDRDLHCQQALRAARGLPRGRFLAALTRLLPAADVVMFLDVSPEEAHRRITARATDSERLEDLRAYRHGYLGLPESARFHRIDADAPFPVVLDEVKDALCRLSRGLSLAGCSAGTTNADLVKLSAEITFTATV